MIASESIQYETTTAFDLATRKLYRSFWTVSMLNLLECERVVYELGLVVFRYLSAAI